MFLPSKALIAIVQSNDRSAEEREWAGKKSDKIGRDS